MSADLNAFLDGASPEEENTVAPEAAPAEAAAPEAPAPDAPPEADAEDEHEPEGLDAAGIRKAMLAERAQRKDWKEKAIRAEEREAELRRQLEAAQKPPPMPQQQPGQPQVTEQQAMYQQLLHDAAVEAEHRANIKRLNKSEAKVRAKVGAEVLDAAVEDFKRARELHPELQTQLLDEDDPYAWVVERAQHFRDATEFARNPDAVRAKLEAEIRAKVLAEVGEAPLTVPTRSPAAGLPPSLASARNAAPRGATPFTGPPPLEDVFGR